MYLYKKELIGPNHPNCKILSLYVFLTRRFTEYPVWQFSRQYFFPAVLLDQRIAEFHKFQDHKTFPVLFIAVDDIFCR